MERQMEELAALSKKATAAAAAARQREFEILGSGRERASRPGSLQTPYQQAPPEGRSSRAKNSQPPPTREAQRTMVQNSLNVGHQISHYPMSSGASE